MLSKNHQHKCEQSDRSQSGSTTVQTNSETDSDQASSLSESLLQPRQHNKVSPGDDNLKTLSELTSLPSSDDKIEQNKPRQSKQSDARQKIKTTCAQRDATAYQNDAQELVENIKVRYWIQQQKSDPLLSKLRIFLLTGDLPEHRKLAKAILFRAPTAILINRVLFKVNDKKAHAIHSGGLPKLQLYVPSGMLPELCKETHESALEGGHRGFQKCLFLMRQNYYADTFSKVLYDTVRSCELCQRFKHTQKPAKYKMSQRLAEEPFQTIGIDIISNLPAAYSIDEKLMNQELQLAMQSTAKGKKKMPPKVKTLFAPYVAILSITCEFTSFTMAYPLKSQNTSHLASIFMRHYLPLAGLPQKVISDNGANLCSRMFEYIYKTLGIFHATTAAYSPASNSYPELANSRIMHILKATLDTRADRWVDFLSAALFVLNSTLGSSTFSPTQLLYGINARRPLSLAPPRPHATLHTPYMEALNRHFDVVQYMRKYAREQLQKARDTAQKSHSRNLHPIDYKPGDLVFVRIQQHTKNTEKDKKFRPKYSGPFLIAMIHHRNPLVKVRDSQLRLSDWIKMDKLKHCLL